MVQPIGAGHKDADNNYIKTIKKKVNICEDIFPYIDKSKLNIEPLEGYKGDNVSVWGITPNDGHKKKWRKIKNGDWVIFYGKDKCFFFSGIIFLKFVSKSLARYLWGKNNDGETYDWLYFIKEGKEHYNFSLDKFNKLEGKKRLAIQGFTVKDPSDETQRILIGLNEYRNEKYPENRSRISQEETSGKSSGSQTNKPKVAETPEELKPVIKRILKLKNDPKHSERDCESLVEEFFRCLGYSEIKLQIGYIDILVYDGETPLITIEVKKKWGLHKDDRQVKSQAFNYSNKSKTRYVIISNGDYYAFYDKSKGFGYDQMFKFEFTLSNFENGDLEKIEFLKNGLLT